MLRRSKTFKILLLKFDSLVQRHCVCFLSQLLKDDRLQRLRNISQGNLTEAGRRARGEYLHVPHHIARTTLDARNRR